MIKVYVITPVGDINNLDITIKSVEKVANLNKKNNFFHLLIYNNKIRNNHVLKKSSNYELKIYVFLTC